MHYDTARELCRAHSDTAILMARGLQAAWDSPRRTCKKVRAIIQDRVIFCNSPMGFSAELPVNGAEHFVQGAPQLSNLDMEPESRVCGSDVGESDGSSTRYLVDDQVNQGTAFR